MKQLLAVAVAALLVALAIVVRDAIDDDGDDTAEPDTGDDSDDGDLVVACVTELEDVCRALDATVRIEDPAETIAAADEIDAWITFDPWPEIAAVAENRTVFPGEPVTLATTPLYLLARTDAIGDACRTAVDWACVADLGSGSNAPALPERESALGVLLLGHAAAGWNYAVRDNAPFAANEFTLPEFEAWFDRLRFTASPVLDMLQLGPAGPIAGGTTGAEIDTVVAASPRADALDRSATPVFGVAAVVVVGPAADEVADEDEVLNALEALGYDVEDPVPPGRTTGLPNAGVLFALQELR